MVKAKHNRKEARDIGVDVEPPGEPCEDPHCPFHGTLPVRGAIIEGTIVSTRMDRTVIVEREHKRYIPKYERYEKRTSRYFAHRPLCFELEQGDSVRIMECRPLSKQVSFVVIERRK